MTKNEISVRLPLLDRKFCKAHIWGVGVDRMALDRVEMTGWVSVFSWRQTNHTHHKMNKIKDNIDVGVTG